MEVSYTVGELKKLIAESSLDYSPKMGDGVESADKTNNRKAYDDAKKRGKDFDGGLKEEKPAEPKLEKNDGNKTMLSINPEKVDDKYKKRVKAQMQGYSSEAEEKNNIEKDPSLEFNKREYDAFTKEAEEMDDNLENLKKSGLQARELAKNDKDYFKKEKVYEGKAKTVSFKKTKFISEGHMISRIPDTLKNEGEVFHMIDCAGNDYLVEWKDAEANVLGHENKIQLTEEMSRIKQLFGYNPNDLYGKKLHNKI